MRLLMPLGVAEFIVMVHDDPAIGHLNPKVQGKAAALYGPAKRTLEEWWRSHDEPEVSP